MTEPGDPQVLEGLLEVTRQLHLEDQLRCVRRWLHHQSGASLSMVYIPGYEDRMVPLDASIPKGDPRYRQVRPLDITSLGTLFPKCWNRFDGFASFLPLGASWAGFHATQTWGLLLSDEKGEPAGVIWLLFDNDPGSAADEVVNEYLSGLIPALSNGLRVRTMQDLVIKDDLARCYNRRYFEEYLPNEIERADRFRSKVSLIFFDMDNLKSINNAWGHNMGSRTLYEISVRVRDRIRKIDKLFRFGGDEFCIVLPETDGPGALEVAERVRVALAESPFLLGKIDEPAGVRVTASFGVASFPDHAREKDALVAAADDAMQRIKQIEKNEVGMATVRGERRV